MFDEIVARYKPISFLCLTSFETRNRFKNHSIASHFYNIDSDSFRIEITIPIYL
ncbi:hypothetical protein LEP1GSC052_3603 [Leptospira kmetyi serovar Malaysia str. Bejo-Iso9]|nr:hypothetical protein LEP1GSC052_3603 [Leptospira kmetyi serovar Malaysia str. Bejo-Iso9]